MMNHKTKTNGRKSGTVAGMILALLLVAEVTVTTVGPIAVGGGGALFAQEGHQKPEEVVFLQARSFLNQGAFKRAVESFQALRGQYPEGYHVFDSYYWEAYARDRLGQLHEAVALLDTMLAVVGIQTDSAAVAIQRVHPVLRLRSRSGSESVNHLVDDARQLRLRILGQLAEQGDPRAAQEVLRQSEMTLGQAWDSIATAMNSAMDSIATTMGPVADSIRAAAREASRVSMRTSGVAELLDALGDLGFRFRNSRLPEGCEDDSVQQEALTSLLRLVETDRVQVLRNVIDREDRCSVNLRVRAVELLARENTPEAEKELINVAMAHTDPRAQRAAVSGLQRFDTPTAVAALVTVLTRSIHEEIQEAAINGLRRSENARARDALSAFAADAAKPEELREDAIVALGRRDDVEAGALIELYSALKTEKLKTTLIDRLRRQVEGGSNQGETWLFNLAFDSSESSEIRSMALDAWGRSPLLELSGLSEAFGRLEDPELRERIFYALYRRAGRARDEAKSEVVRKMVELARLETDDGVRERAVYWLGRTGSQEAVEYLLELLRGPAANRSQ